MDSYDKFGRALSMKKFWERYVVPVDPKIIYMTWCRFVKSISKAVTTKQELILDKFVEKKATENEMEKSSLQNILAISNATLDALIENPDILAKVPIKERMKWLFSAMKARDSRMVALTKVNAEKRKTTMFEDMLQAAQYGEIEHEEFSSPPEHAPEPPKPQEKPQIVPPQPAVIDFNPDEI